MHQQARYQSRFYTAVLAPHFTLRLLLATVILFGGVLAASQSAWAQGQPITFSAVGDVPYSTSERSEFQQHMDNHDLYSPSEFLVHLGDIKSGASECVESWYRDMKTYLRSLSVPGFILPGDNEWNNCTNPTQAWAYWVTHLLAVEQTACGLPLIERQTVRTENFAFVKSGVLFIGINKVNGGLNSSEQQTRLQQDADWITYQMQTKGGAVRATVILAQASPATEPLESQFRSAALAFGKPVLYIHGDGHVWTYDNPWRESNITKVQVDRGSIEHPPVQVTVTMDVANMFVLNRDPWPTGTLPLNRPPCVEAGPDQQVVLANGAVLIGKVSDDGEPIPANLTMNWTHVTGPGVVSFGTPGAATTTAQFSAEGLYELRLTASDGAFVTADTVLVDAQINPAPVVTVTAPANGSTFNESQTVTFIGSASDLEEGDLTASLTWTSNLDGAIGTGGQVSTSVLSLGAHTVTASVTDAGGKTSSNVITVTIVVVPATTTVQVRVASSTDDAEESSIGVVSLDSSDLELVAEGGVSQTVGMRFNGVAVPQGATILDSWIQFQADETASTATALTIQGEATNSAATFTTATANVSSRPRTTAGVSWSPVPWNTVDVAGPDQRTPIINSVIQEVVNRPGWSSGNSLAIVITGTGKRTAEAHDGVPGAAPLLHVEFTTQTLPPDIDVTPGTHGYGSVSVGTIMVQTFAVRNMGNANLQVTGTSLVGGQAAEFAITQGGAPFTVAGGATHNVDVRFAPTSAGLKGTTLRLTSDDADENPLDIALSGTGTTAPDIDVTPNPYAYGSVAVGANAVRTFAIRNVGNMDLQVTAISLVGGQAAEFAITQGGAPFTVAAGATHNLDVSFAPTSFGVKSTTLRLSSDDPDENPLDVALSGTAMAPDIDMSPTSHDYGLVPVGANVVRTFAIRNLGNSDLQVTATSLQGGQASEFAITQGGAPFTVAPGVTHNLDVSFAPTSFGIKTTTLRVTSTDPDENPVDVALSGTGSTVPDIDVAPNPYAYGSLAVGATAVKTFAIRNVGNGNLQVSAASLVGGQVGEFAITQGGAPFTVAAGATHNLDVRFAPTSIGAKSTTLRLTSDDPDEGSVDVALSGTGLGPDIDITPNPYDYGTVLVGGNMVGTFAIRNVGNTDLQVTAASLEGGLAGEFAITQGGAPFTVAPGATRNLDVRFAPTSVGLKTTTLRVTSTDPDENPVDVSLRGTGVQPDIAVTPGSHDYGTQATGTSTTQAFVISNAGTSNLVVGQSSLTGPDAGSFGFVSGQAGFTIAPGGTGTIQVRFSPLTNGAKTATLTIPSNDPDENPLLIALTGFGTTMPTFQEVRQGGSGNASSVTTTAGLTGVSGHLYLAAVSTTPHVSVNTMSGLGMTWTRVAAQCGGRSQTGIELWWAQGAASNGSVTANLASPATNALISVARYSGVAATNPVAPLVAGNTIGVNGACSGGSTTAAYSFGVTTTSSPAVVFGAAALKNRTHTPGTGYTERAEVAQGKGQDTVRIALMDRAVPVAASLPLNGTLSGPADWAVIGVELRPDGQ